MVGTLKISSIQKKFFEVIILNTEEFITPHSPVDTAFCAIAKADRNETITEMLSQIGVRRVVFWQSQHSIPKPPYDKKLLKLKNLSIESAMQCGRESPIKVEILEKKEQFKNALLQANSSILLCSLKENSISLKEAITSQSAYSFITGPEGDFSEEEFDLFKLLEIQPITLGENVFKSDAAAVVAASMISALSST